MFTFSPVLVLADKLKWMFMKNKKTVKCLLTNLLSCLHCLYWCHYICCICGNKYTFSSNKTLNHNLPAPYLKDKTWKFLNGRKPPPALLCSPCSCLRGPRSISIKTSSFMISANGDSGGIQLANTQTFSSLKKTAAAIVNKTITDCRRLPSPPHRKM